jgi:hypothetical protein
MRISRTNGIDQDVQNNPTNYRGHKDQQQETQKGAREKKRTQKFIKRNKWKKLKRKTYHNQYQEQDHIRTIQNLSSHNLTTTELLVLSKGLGFCPTPPKPDKISINIDILRITRKLRLMYNFHEIDTPEEEQSKPNRRFKIPSTWTPRTGQNHTLDLFCNLIEHEILTGEPTTVK